MVMRIQNILTVLILATFVIWVLAIAAFGHDATRPELNDWFNHLKSGRGLCCSYADGESLSDVQWDTQDGHYRVFLDNKWINVPDDAVIKEPNREGVAWVWPLRYNGGVYDIRCFLPGAGT